VHFLDMLSITLGSLLLKGGRSPSLGKCIPTGIVSPPFPFQINKINSPSPHPRHYCYNQLYLANLRLKTVNICIIEPSGVKTAFDGHSKAHIKPHPAYAGDDMPSRQLEKYVNMGIKSGVGMIEPQAVAETIYGIASRGERIPLRLPLGRVAWQMAKAKAEGWLEELEVVKEVSFMGRGS